jgi:8-oxo-dGTP pyrophosphatase MutT (NUDIX family)
LREIPDAGVRRVSAEGAADLERTDHGHPPGIVIGGTRGVFCYRVIGGWPIPVTMPHSARTPNTHQTELAAAVPFRLDEHGVVEVLLITSASGVWIVPKGGVEPGQTPEGAALAEAWEEAGVEGCITGERLGVWHTSRRGKPAVATVYPMLVERCAARWPEDHERSRRWVSVRRAVELVESAEVRGALVRLARRVREMLTNRAA